MKSIVKMGSFALLGLMMTTTAFGFGFGRPKADPDARATGASGYRLVFSQVTGAYDGLSNTELQNGGYNAVAPVTDDANGRAGIPGSTIWVTGAYVSTMPAACPSSTSGKIALTVYNYHTRQSAAATLDRKSAALSVANDRLIAECKRDSLLAMSSSGSLKFVVIVSGNGAPSAPSDGLCSFDLSLMQNISCGVCASGTPGC